MFWKAVGSFESYRVATIAPQGPAACRFLHRLSSPNTEVAFRMGSDEDIQEAAARLAFKGVSEPWLAKLMNHRGMQS
eukprot:2175372-Alexandrium_andersonii.AAC.1